MLRFTLARIRRADSIGIVGMTALIVCAAAMIAGTFAMLFFRAYPFANSEELVLIWENDLEISVERLPVTEHAFPIYQSKLSSLVSLAHFFPPRPNLPATLAEDGQSIEIAGASPGLFEVLRVTPMHGRSFSTEEGLMGAEPVAVLSHRLWRAKFGGDTSIIGKPIDVHWLGDRQAFRVVGIMPADLAFPFPLYSDKPDLWVATQEVGGTRFLPGHNFYVIGRMKEGVSLAAVRTGVTVIAQEIARDHPRVYGAISATVVPLRAESLREVGWVAAAFAVAFLSVLGIGVTNILHLLLARTRSRMSELATRGALGASKASLGWLLAIDAAVLATAGSVIGALAAASASQSMLALLPDQILVPSTAQHIAPLVLIITCVAAVAAVTGLSILIARKTLSADGAMVALWQQRALSGLDRSYSLNRIGDVALLWQVGTACALATLTLGLSAQAAQHLARGEALRPTTLLSLDVRFDNDAPMAPAELESLLSTLQKDPALAGVALLDRYPYSGVLSEVELDGTSRSNASKPATLHVATTGLPAVFGIEVLDGRWFTASDRPDGRRVAVVNEAFARRYEGNGRIVGTSLRTSWGDEPGAPFEIVGVVRDDARLGAQAEVPAVYLSWEQAPIRNVTLVVRTRDDARSVASAVRDRVLAIAPAHVRIPQIRTGEDVLMEETAPVRLMSNQFRAVSLAALVLACGGVYSIVSFRLNARRKEFAVRAAVGSSARRLVLLGLGETSFRLAAGVVAGWFGAALIARALPGVDAAVPQLQSLPYAAAGVALFVVGIMSAMVPLLRMAQVDPASVLRT